MDLEAGIVTVDAAASKVHRRRIVHLQPAAIGWLRHARELGDDLPLPHVRREEAEKFWRLVPREYRNS